MLIDLKNIIKTYQAGDSQIPVLKGINLQIEKGEFVSIMGQSGSGKSTLMNIIGMLDNPTEGSYFFDGRDVSHFADDDQAHVRRMSIGFIFQSYNLLKKTSAIDQVALPLMYQGVGKAERYERAFSALKKVGLEDKAYSMPNALSGGQQQRIAIARALVTDPPLILGDEPTGALDTATGHEIMELITKLNQEGHTVVIITHEPEVDAYARRHCLIRDGLFVI